MGIREYFEKNLEKDLKFQDFEIQAEKEGKFVPDFYVEKEIPEEKWDVLKKLYLTYGFTKNDAEYLPIIGRCSRPKDVYNCGNFICNPPEKPSLYGLPSGHTQIVSFFSVLSIVALLIGYYEEKISIIRTLLLILIIMIYLVAIGLSRIYVAKCHTFNQVIVGYIIGITLGMVYSFFYCLVKN